MKTVLIIATLVEVAILVLVLAGYLIAIAATLRRVSSTLGLVTFGVRAIEKQTAPIGPVLKDINGALEQVADALGAVSGRAPASAGPRPGDLASDQPQEIAAAPRETSGGGEPPTAAS